MTRSRAYALTVVGGVVASGAAFLAASRAWRTVTLTPDGMPSDTVEVTGTSALPLVGAMTVVLLAAFLAVLASAGWVRRLVGALICVAALAGLGAVLLGGPALDDAVTDAVGRSPAMTGDAGAESTAADGADATPWPFVTALALVTALAGGAVVVRSGASWPSMGRRYEAPTGRREEDDDPWKALDRGEDPTL